MKKSIERLIMSDDDLVRLDVKANVNYAGVGVVTITAYSRGGGKIVGSLLPHEIKEVGVACFEEAETAYSNDILYNLMRDTLDLDDDVISEFIIAFRKSREE